LLLLAVLLVWPLVAFGGRAATTAVPFSLACIGYALLRSRRLGFGNSLDIALVGVLAIVALQAVSLPAAVVALLSPHAADLRSRLALQQAETPWATLSIDMTATLWAWLVTAGAIALFWIARANFRHGGIRRIVRIISAVGFALSLLAIAQAATAGRSIYWRFPTEFEGPLPFGPFVNRNHCATWFIMALPLVLGYVAARSNRRIELPDHVATRTRLASAIDPRAMWLLTAAGAMSVALLLSLSRSGALALGVSSATTLLACRERLDAKRRRAVLVTASALALMAIAWVDVPALQARIAGTETGLKDRVGIWRETLPIVRDFWLTGTGAGTYERAMFSYQAPGGAVYFNQAHNHYLQVASEGGALLALAVIVALTMLVRVGRRRIAADDTGLAWIRIGAACGLSAVALQSVWETGLVMPANAALAAVLAAVLTHRRE
jgi:putative inorganic carbon (hco3(-)) transporter